ncbi:ATP-dependent DNA helicase RecG [soil metagenome]
MDLRELKVSELPLVGPTYAKKLQKLEIETVFDLFHHVPFRFLDFSKNVKIRDLQIGETATIKGTVTSFVNQYTKKGRPMQIVTIEDESGKINAMWFNQIYLSRTFRKGTKVAIAGELNFMGRQKAIISPEYEILNEDGDQIHTGNLIAVYSGTAGISSKWLRRKIYDAFEKYKDEIEEFLPQQILEKNDLMDFRMAIEKVHFPKSMEEFEKAKRRLAFNELLYLHTKNIRRKKAWEKKKLKELIKINKTKINIFTKSLPFELTDSQKIVVDEIFSDLQKDIPMNRLLEGDVGSGKTVVAAAAMYAVFLNDRKSVLMAPTQILANQHYQTLNKLFEKLNVKIGLITSLTKINADADILVGTHALLNKKIDLKRVALVVIDEQHKFGVEQRNIIVKQSGRPHILTMTATPIPRTVALTFFGDVALSTLNELPKGRQKIVTWVIPENKRESGFEWIHDKIIKEKIQAYIVCPLIDESDKETMIEVKAANKEFEILENKFKDLKIGLLHGKLKATEKDEVLAKFKNGEINILVSTPVVEVGIDIANATIMVIEAADRFGLASLHQLRGRVGRGSIKSFCLLMTENESEKTEIRLNAMTKTASGFELAELDLAMRGPGEIYGSNQSGFPELRIADWNDVEMIRTTKDVAEKMSNQL